MDELKNVAIALESAANALRIISDKLEQEQQRVNQLEEETYKNKYLKDKMIQLLMEFN